MSTPTLVQGEWLEADGLGGFASGRASGLRARRYHALLLASKVPPTERFVLVNGVDAVVVTPAGEFSITPHKFAPGVITGTPGVELESFAHEPWPTWVWRVGDGVRVRVEVLVPKGSPTAIVSWKLIERKPEVRLRVRPLLSGRDYHSLHHENTGFRFEASVIGETVAWSPYPGVPLVQVRHNGKYQHSPVWYRNFEYDDERERGLDFTEDLASPGTFDFDLSSGEAILVMASDTPGTAVNIGPSTLSNAVSSTRATEAARREALGGPLERAADAYIVCRESGSTILAGYPWFADWGRDAFIALRGLCLATGRLDEARGILVRWASSVSEGMLPNRFPDQGDTPDYNSVDASLWFAIAAGEYLEFMEREGRAVPAEDLRALRDAIESIVSGYTNGTRYGIRCGHDGLLAAGVPGVQLTWMDAKVGDWVVTPRVGKPVEVQALWINALAVAGRFKARWRSAIERARESFARRFWNEVDGCLYDVIDCDHIPGRVDASVRPNQLLALGGLPIPLIEGYGARQIVGKLELALWTPMGPRSLSPEEPGYVGRYQGDVRQRDGAYHQGTVWPWLIGAFVEAWVRVNGGTEAAKVEARVRFLNPLLNRLLGRSGPSVGGLGHVAEIADGDAPHAPRGCPFQAWSLAEVIRLDRIVLGPAMAPVLEPTTRLRRAASLV
jgi:predicted glycogen debranching enzyme